MDLGGPRSAQIRIFIVFCCFFLQILGCVGPAVGPAGSARVGPAASAWPRRPASARLRRASCVGPAPRRPGAASARWPASAHVSLRRPVSARVGPAVSARGLAVSARVGPRWPVSACVGPRRPASARLCQPGRLGAVPARPCRPGRVGQVVSAFIIYRPARIGPLASSRRPSFRLPASATRLPPVCLLPAACCPPTARPPRSRTLKSRTPEISNSETIPYSDRLKTWSDSLW